MTRANAVTQTSISQEELMNENKEIQKQALFCWYYTWRLRWSWASRHVDSAARVCSSVHVGVCLTNDARAADRAIPHTSSRVVKTAVPTELQNGLRSCRYRSRCSADADDDDSALTPQWDCPLARSRCVSSRLWLQSS